MDESHRLYTVDIDCRTSLADFQLNGSPDPSPPARLIHSKDMEWKIRWSDILERMTVVHSEEELHQLIDTATSQRGVSVIAFVNAHSLNSVCASRGQMDVLQGFDYLLRDGVGVSFLMRWLGQEPGLNLNGTDLIPAILVQRRFDTVALYGTVDEFAQRARTLIGELTDTPPENIYTAHGFLPPSDYLALARTTRPSCIILGMGTPKQEEVAALLRTNLTHDCVVICGGAIIDFMGGRFKRAPLIVRRLRFEWLYRLHHEPIRLFKRYVIGNPVFLLRALLLAVLGTHKRRGSGWSR